MLVDNSHESNRSIVRSQNRSIMGRCAACAAGSLAGVHICSYLLVPLSATSLMTVFLPYSGFHLSRTDFFFPSFPIFLSFSTFRELQQTFLWLETHHRMREASFFLPLFSRGVVESRRRKEKKILKNRCRKFSKKKEVKKERKKSAENG